MSLSSPEDDLQRQDLSVPRSVSPLTSLSAAADLRAKMLLESTKLPQRHEENEPRERDSSGASAHATFELQRALQSEDEFERILRRVGLDAYARGVGLRAGTPTGDFFGSVLRQDGGVSLLVGDACGHDAQDVWDNAVRFCLFLSQPEVARKLGLTPSDPRELLLDVDRGCNFRGNFAHDSITLTHVLIDPASGVFSVANAANPCPVIVVGPRGARRIQAKGASISHPDLEACGASYLSSEATVLSGVLDVGEMLLLGTDGLVDSEDENGVPLGETLEGRLMQERVWELSPRQALDAAFSMIKVRKDDVAIMVAKRTC